MLELTSADPLEKRNEPDRDEEYSELFLENQLCLALYNTTNSITRAYATALQPFGITYPQMLCMMALWQRAPRTVTEISIALDLGKPTVTPLLVRLEEQGLVVRTRDVVDERRVYVRLSPRGQDIKRPVMLARRELVCAVALSQAEFTGLRSRLHDLHGRLGRLS